MMSDTKDEQQVDVELSKLLDTALNDFERLKNTDDELDQMMETMDQRDLQKSADDFDLILERLKSSMKCSTSDGETFKDSSNVESSMNKDFSDADKKAAKQLQDLLKLVPLETEDEESEGSDLTFKTLEKVISSLLDKSFMAPPIDDLLEKFPKYLAEHNEIDSETRKRYEKQIELLQCISNEYKKSDPTTVEERNLQFEKIKSSMAELQEYGYPPEELMGEVPEGWKMDSESGLPVISDLNRASELCSLM